MNIKEILFDLIVEQRPAQSQQNNVRTVFIKRCSDIFLLTLNRFFLTENMISKMIYKREIPCRKKRSRSHFNDTNRTYDAQKSHFNNF